MSVADKSLMLQLIRESLAMSDVLPVIVRDVDVESRKAALWRLRDALLAEPVDGESVAGESGE